MPNQGWPEHHYGMTLRDWFAGQALSGVGKHLPDHHPWLANHCYDLADAMLAEKDRRDAQ
jgi:hypothetical protein